MPHLELNKIRRGWTSGHGNSPFQWVRRQERKISTIEIGQLKLYKFCKKIISNMVCIFASPIRHGIVKMAYISIIQIWKMHENWLNELRQFRFWSIHEYHHVPVENENNRKHTHTSLTQVLSSNCYGLKFPMSCKKKERKKKTSANFVHSCITF